MKCCFKIQMPQTEAMDAALRASDATLTNFEQIFMTHSPSTKRKVL